MQVPEIMLYQGTACVAIIPVGYHTCWISYQERALLRMNACHVPAATVFLVCVLLVLCVCVCTSNSAALALQCVPLSVLKEGDKT